MVALHVNYKVVKLFPNQAMGVRIQNQKAGYLNRPQDLQVLSM